MPEAPINNALMAHNLLSAIPVAVFWKDPLGIYVDCNDEFLNLMNLSSSGEIVGKTDLQLPWRELSPAINMADKCALASASTVKSEHILPIDKNKKISVIIKRKSFFDGNGNCIGIIGSIFNSIERDNAEIYLDNIISNLPGHVYWKDQNGIMLGSNDSNARHAGLKCASDMIGKSDYDLFPKQEADHLRSSDTEIMVSGRAKIVEEPRTLSDGSIAIYLSHKVPLKDRGNNVIGILGISLDITDLKEAQAKEKRALEEAAGANARARAQEEIQKAILMFSGTMAHDLRTPLSTITLIASLLKKLLPVILPVYKKYKDSDEEASEEAPYIAPYQLTALEEVSQNLLDCTQEANAYIDATLKMVKGSASGAELLRTQDLVACSMEKIGRRVVMNFPFKEGESEKLHLDSSNDFEFMGNAIFMLRIFQNLVKNSFEQIHLKGRGEIFIRFERGDQFNSLIIKDTAGGVPASVPEHLFDGFNSTKKGGTGLGLSSAKQIMQAFGGDIVCRLVDGDCIEFILTFPKIIKPE